MAMAFHASWSFGDSRDVNSMTGDEEAKAFISESLIWWLHRTCSELLQVQQPEGLIYQKPQNTGIISHCLIPHPDPNHSVERFLLAWPFQSHRHHYVPNHNGCSHLYRRVDAKKKRAPRSIFVVRTNSRKQPDNDEPKHMKALQVQGTKTENA